MDFHWEPKDDEVPTADFGLKLDTPICVEKIVELVDPVTGVFVAITSLSTL